jgi:hypothetical protein
MAGGRVTMDMTSEVQHFDSKVQGWRIDGRLIADTYLVQAQVGRGGMGEVYEARHIRLGTSVAMKFLRGGPRGDVRSRERFEREARRAASVRHENVVRVFDYGNLDDGTPYLVMERLLGEDLRTLLEREGPLPIRRAVSLLRGACHGLSAVHSAGLIHRDLKPANLFVERPRAGVEITKILDFGVAKLLEVETTNPGELVGTVQYMAPEQLDDGTSVSARTDVYALGAILYECLAGVAAHCRKTVQETMFDIVHRDVSWPAELRSIPKELEATLLKALSRGVDARFETVEAFAQALEPFGPMQQSGQSPALGANETTVDTRELGVGQPQRRRTAAAAWGIVACAAGLGMGWAARGASAAASRHEVLTAIGSPPHVPLSIPQCVCEPPTDGVTALDARSAAPLATTGKSGMGAHLVLSSKHPHVSHSLDRHEAPEPTAGPLLMPPEHRRFDPANPYAPSDTSVASTASNN